MDLQYLETLPVCEKDDSILIPKHIFVYFKIGTPFAVRAYYCGKCKTYNGYSEGEIEKLARELLPAYCSGKEISKLEIL